MRVNEIFYSIQGEGVHQGLPTSFVRLQGCNLFPTGCIYCDTKYAQDPSGGMDLSIQEVVEKVSKFYGSTYKRWVCITGGEPLVQAEELDKLVTLLKYGGFLVSVETNGTMPKPIWWTKVDSWVIDYKLTLANISSPFQPAWFSTRAQDQLKFVVGNEGDLSQANSVMINNSSCPAVFLVSPVLGKNWYTGSTWVSPSLVEEMVKVVQERRARLSLQIHKFLWGLDKRGV
jgi:7-carboxy-7-deazaguanine synthase